MSAAQPSIHLYAELLLHINTVSLHGSFEAVDEPTTSSATLYTDGPILRVSHGGSTAKLRLPVQTISTASSTVRLPPGRPKEFTARLEVKATDLAHVVALREDAEIDVPWGATDLSSESCISCRSCGSAIVKARASDAGYEDGKLVDSTIKEWKDLPSENWAEMMDFWHCHKPVEHHSPQDVDDAPSQKGYSASNTLQAVSGVGLIDVSSFLFAPDDVACVKELASKDPAQPDQLTCALPSCFQLLGFTDARASGYRIHKWAVSVQPTLHSERQCFPEEQWVTAQMLSIMDSQSVRKFTVKKPPQTADEESSTWLLWLFTPDVYFCSSALPSLSLKNNSDKDSEEPAASVRACKILFRRLQASAPSADAPVATTSEEPLDLPAPLATALFAALATSANLLPRAARTYGAWQVGLLRRFAREDVRDATHRVDGSG